MGVSEEEQVKNWVESLHEEVTQKLPNSEGGNVNPNAKSSKDSNKDKHKEVYTETHNQTVKSKTKKES